MPQLMGGAGRVALQRVAVCDHAWQREEMRERYGVPRCRLREKPARKTAVAILSVAAPDAGLHPFLSGTPRCGARPSRTTQVTGAGTQPTLERVIAR